MWTVAVQNSDEPIYRWSLYFHFNDQKHASLSRILFSGLSTRCGNAADS